jgi:predicted HTH transcriptional regulator
MTALRRWQSSASGDFNQFIDAPEGLEIEFKGEPYRLEQDSQKFELAKDVSALANAAGGLIVIGARTQRDDQVAVDEPLWKPGG